MKRNLTILYKTFSFLIVIPVSLLTEYFFPEFKINIGFFIGWIIGNITHQFWSKPLYLDYIKTEKNILKIAYSNPLLKKGTEAYELENVLALRIKKPNFFSNYGKIEFEFNGLNRKFVFLKTDRKRIINDTKEIVELKKTAYNTV